MWCLVVYVCVLCCCVLHAVCCCLAHVCCVLQDVLSLLLDCRKAGPWAAGPVAESPLYQVSSLPTHTYPHTLTPPFL